MKITSQPPSRRNTGYVLIMIMCFLAASLLIFASMMYWTATNSNITQRSNAFNQAEAAAESFTENNLAYMIRDFTSQSLNPASTYTSYYPNQTNWPIQYQFTNISLSIGATNWSTLGSQFAGLWGTVQNCTNTVTASAILASGSAPVSVPATVQQVIQFASIPVFQFAIFYNMDLELNPGGPMIIGGPVHANGNIYTTAPGGSLIYSTNVEATGTVNLHRSPYDPNPSVSGGVVFTDTQNNPKNSANELSMPIGTNNSASAVASILALPPSNIIVPSVSAYSPTGSVYLYNEADLIITNYSPYGPPTNFAVFYDNQNASPQLTQIPPDVFIITSNSAVKGGSTIWTFTTNSYYSFVTNATFYDYREYKTVQALQLNVSNLVVWLTNYSTNVFLGVCRGGYQYDQMNNTGSTSKGHGIDSVYIYNNIPMTTSTLPGVRVINGQRLPPYGLTVATPQPLYVEGNYNVQTNASGTPNALTLYSTTNGCALPAALMGDAVTVLSSSWQDSWNSGTSLGTRNPTATTINAACLEGIVPSFQAASGYRYYSGGVENFVRLLENWNSGIYLTYNGSIVVMFTSQYATNVWQNTGNYYNPPGRNWGFDLNFSRGQNYLPPLTPQVKDVIRGAWAAW